MGRKGRKTRRAQQFRRILPHNQTLCWTGTPVAHTRMQRGVSYRTDGLHGYRLRRKLPLDVDDRNRDMPMLIAALQMVSTPDVDRNLAAAAALIAEAARAGAQLVALPEYFCLMGRSDRDKLALAEVPGEGPIQRMLADAARDHGVWVLGGTLPLRTADPARVFNSSLAFAPDGRQAARYDKMYLFRYDNGRERYDEG